jgi:hypothetical protein
MCSRTLSTVSTCCMSKSLESGVIAPLLLRLWATQPARRRIHHPTAQATVYVIALELSSRSPGIRVHDCNCLVEWLD